MIFTLISKKEINEKDILIIKTEVKALINICQRTIIITIIS
jgi:hypothetical protein